jgi:2-polyprenyl-6-hydroxyphenyl methylase/3-demethylubiquinone-9 3-methyltransferase
MATTRSTIDKDESDRFAALAEEWWDETGSMAPLHRMNPVRLAFLRDALLAHFGADHARPQRSKPLDGLRILDVGCGVGLVCEPMRRLGATVTGIDAAADVIRAARAHAKAMRLDIDYRVVAPEDLTETYDAVIALEVVEHVADHALFLDSLCGLVAPDGALALSTLNRTPIAFAMAIVGAEYVMGWLPRGTHDWRKFVKPSELARGLGARDFRITRLSGISYDPLARTWSLSRDLAVNYLAFAKRA